MKTADKILEEALILFSIHGYQGVSVEMIAKAVGIKASSLYKHYRNKQSIFEGIFTMMKDRYQGQEKLLNIPQGAEDVQHFYQQLQPDQLEKISEDLFLYFIKDEKEARFRHLLIIEQFQNPHIGEILHQRYYEEPLLFQKELFQSMMDVGVFKEGDAKIAALQFFSPIMMLLNCCEQGGISVEEALAELRKHVQKFRQLYSKE
ncbi:TetR family transcriptional regulator [Candidatus Enterococcus ferrettii]|uniref:HTH tetR-type domain-containing protein n=1 Tax=Candidatus Enterococcus ferrettii TaxID=2815324 RepID=A0ABV0ETW0_9ENTE|nr:TetR/AcrR family transcriptional regulator [Enterococcus sp. 665A]